MRYAYGLTSALLVGGAFATLVGGYPAGAQVAQNDDSRMAQVVPRAGAPASFADLTEQLQPAVVNISTRQRVEVQQRGGSLADLFGMRQRSPQGEPQTREGGSLGSGFIVSADGFVVTNNHVIAPATDRSGRVRGTVEQILVTLPDGTEFEAEVIGADPSSDLAVLKINSAQPLPFVKFGNSENTRVGDWVIAIGNPFGLGGTVTSGIISSVLRTAGGGAYDRYLQTDASINQGNSGGPLFDMQGNVIGINNAIISPSGGNVGIGFAIPAETAAPIVEQLKRGEAVERGYLGVGIAPVDDDLADSLGIDRKRGEIIQQVEPDQPAARAGIEAGDIVLSVNGKPVTQEQTLSFLVANIDPGTTVPIELIRRGDRQTVRARVGTRPSDEELRSRQMFNPDNDADEIPEGGDDEASPLIEKLGLQVVDITPEIARQLGVPRDTQGVAVLQVDPNSDATRKGLRRRDIILTANYQPVSSIADLEAQIRAAERGDRNAVLLRVQTPGGRALRYVAVRLR
ncbi:MAG: Do family serine endopeptidase [Pontixanthobacter sp.]